MTGVATTPGADDAALAERVRRGDERAFTELVERHHSGLIRVARRIVKVLPRMCGLRYDASR